MFPSINTKNNSLKTFHYHRNTLQQPHIIKHDAHY